MRARMGMGSVLLLGGALIVGCHDNKKTEASAEKPVVVVKATPQPQDPIIFEPQQFPNVYPDDRLHVIGYPAMKPENNQHLIDDHAQRMVAAGARQDGMLQKYDFDGDELSASGRNRLDLMLQGAPAHGMLMVYVPGGAAGQLAAVDKYVKDSQWASVKVQAKAGLNPDAGAPASAGLAALKKMEKESATSGSGGSGGSGGGYSSGSGSSSGSSGSGGQ